MILDNTRLPEPTQFRRSRVTCMEHPSHGPSDTHDIFPPRHLPLQGAIEDLSHAQIDHTHRPIVPDQHIPRGYIAMCHTMIVQATQRT
eukprot:32742-Eustigmatos_ZCMA.PRE.1